MTFYCCVSRILKAVPIALDDTHSYGSLLLLLISSVQEALTKESITSPCAEPIRLNLTSIIHRGSLNAFRAACDLQKATGDAEEATAKCRVIYT